MNSLDPWYQAREAMTDAVIADLYGSDKDRELEEPPLDRFIVGILHPPGIDGRPTEVEVADEEPESEAGTGPDASFDPAVSFAHLRYPSTVGMTFSVSESTSLVEIDIEADRYEPIDSATEPPAKQQIGTRAATRVQRWRLLPAVRQRIAFDPRGGNQTITVVEGLELRVICRPPRSENVSVTVVLVNTFVKPEVGPSDGFAWLRPRLVAHTVSGQFLDRSPDRLDDGHLDADELSGELLYRRERKLAVGHGVATTWTEDERVVRIETTFFPHHDLQLAEADIASAPTLSMRELSANGVIAPLEGLIAAYERWIDTQRRLVHTLDEPLTATAERHLEAARKTAERLAAGVQLLISDPEVDRAFRLMNAAMRSQRARQEMIRSKGKADPDADAEWRPFQMAFILLNLESISDPGSPDRSTADLLWFPTGGGKTEAYLGLIAFTLVLRRLRRSGGDADGGGVGVLMRYTLRLLTLQQFERAAGLICALEIIRRDNEELSTAQAFSVGLWVGQGATPNDVKGADVALRKRRQGERAGDGGDPMQLLRCPWCGSPLTPDDYRADRVSDRVHITCSDPACAFRSGLPVVVVDSDVYAQRPSLLIGTVDKFAMLAWNERAGNLFGNGHYAPPDLVVQDELHLISGPLGTLVGLYETAVDYLSRDPATGATPKIVASTATIRRAHDQVRAVFARTASQFPPPGLDAHDSFFAVDAPAYAKGTRRYVGLMSPSASHATLLVRTYAALLQAGKDLDCSDEVRDAYWTLLGYFNSLRVLGSAYIQSIDDVRDRVKVVARRHGTAARETKSPSELTSRINSSQIPEELELLATSMPDPKSPDIVLATNMISVGVDVDRLGLMAVMGQPQTTAEYIQASSRVGRRFPGLVFTMYNASRSRDLSHYEGFIPYHRSLYRQVEATGATPFAARALDRGLHGVLVSMARHSVAGAAGDKAVSVPTFGEALDQLRQVILTRFDATHIGTSGDGIRDRLRSAIDDLINQWLDGVGDQGVDRYVHWRSDAQGKSLIVPAGGGLGGSTGEALTELFPPSAAPWPTLTSLRNVDQESSLRIIRSRKKKASET